jgi:hypothetical protein
MLIKQKVKELPSLHSYLNLILSKLCVIFTYSSSSSFIYSTHTIRFYMRA